MIEKSFIINSVDELSQVSDLLISWRDKSDIIAFYGPMGAGKTTLIKNLCHKLGVTDEVNSPTFALVNEYPTPVEGCLLEWPELIDPLMPDHFIKVEIALGDTDNSRKIKCMVL